VNGDQGIRGLDRILELQELDLAIDRLSARRQELESGEDLRTARERVEGLEERVGETRLALDSVDQEQRRLETEVASLEAKIGAEQRRLYDGSVANPKELESIQHEVEALGRRKSHIEDDVLSQMERREELGVRLDPLEKELAEARDRLTEIGGASVTELEDIGRALAERVAERAALITAIDDELLELYEDLRAQTKGVGAAALEDGVCQGCHQKLSPLELERIKRSEGIRRCEYCRRILVLA
jgi:predicted  nucleic acid-binding Zn-ribbon protein